jgi:hypothetical protein
MGYEKLMEKAEQIRVKAIEEATLELGGRRNSGSYMQTKGPELEAEFSGIPGDFEPFSRMPNPASFDGPIAELSTAMTKLSSGQLSTDPISTNGRIHPANVTLAQLSSTANFVTGWSGKAASDFVTGYVDPFPYVVSNQFTALAALKSSLEAQRAMWAKARENIWDIADQTYNRLEVMTDCGSNEWTMAFTVVASIAAVAAVPFTGGASLLVITAIGATAQVVAAVEIKDPPEKDIKGETTRPVISSMREAIQKQYETINETEIRIRDSVSNLNDLIYGQKDLFVSKRPTLADGKASNIRDYVGVTD